MPEINFTIDEQTGEMEMKVEGVQGPQCADVAKIVTELTGAPHVRNVKTSLTLRNSKDAAMVPMELKGNL